MKNDKYWATRAARLMFGYMDEAEAQADTVAEVYRKASGYLTEQANAVFSRYMNKYGITEQEARALISRMRNREDIQELLRKLENSGISTEEERQLLMELDAPAYRARIERLKHLQAQIDSVMETVYQRELAQTTAFYEDLTGEAYNRAMFEIQQRAGYGFGFSGLDNRTVNRILKSKWSGKNYSKRIWKNTNAVAQKVKEELLVNFITGRTNREVAKMIQEKFSSGAMQARRLVRTESCFIAGEVTAQAYKEAGIEKYRYVATLDLRTSAICRELDGREFLVKDRKPGTNCPPMHPWCRSTTIAAPTAEELAGMKRRARDPKTGKSILVPASMTYKEWYQKFVKGKPEAEAKERAIKNLAADRKQHERYRKILGDEVPETLEEFQEMRYNDPERYEYLKRLYRVANQYEVNNGEMSAVKIKELHDEAVRQKALFNSKGRKGTNMGIMELDGEKYYANSGASYSSDSKAKSYKGNKHKLILLPERQRFVTKALKQDGHNRKVDSEAKLFEFAARIADDGKEHTIYLLSERCMCESCWGVMRQFIERYPKVKVNVASHRYDIAMRSRNRNLIFEAEVQEVFDALE